MGKNSGVMKGLLLIVALAAALCHAQYQTTMVFANATCEPTILSSLMRWNSILADSCTPQPCEEVDGVWRQVVCDTTAMFPPGSAYIGWEQYVSNEACKSSDRSGTNVISANYWRNGLCFDDVRAQCKEPVGSSPAVQIQSWLTGGNTCPGNPASFHTVVDTCTAPGTTGDTRVLTCGYNTPGRFRTVRVQDGEQCSASQPAAAVYQEAGSAVQHAAVPHVVRLRTQRDLLGRHNNVSGHQRSRPGAARLRTGPVLLGRVDGSALHHQRPVRAAHQPGPGDVAAHRLQRRHARHDHLGQPELRGPEHVHLRL